MNDLPPLMTDQRKIDQDHLRLLAVFHFVGAALAVLGLVFLLVHYLFFHAVMANPDMWKGQKGGSPPPEVFFAFLRIFYVLFGFFLLASLVGNLLSAIFLGQRRHRTFSLLVAGLNCLHVPVGTVLGVFTFVVLLRPSVREAYDAGAPPALPLVPPAP
jgi:hypothetical protein